MNDHRQRIALLGLGANLGEPAAQVREAIRQLSLMVRVLDVSSLYLTEPVGGPEQPSYINAVCSVRTGLTPAALLALCRAVEERMGRRRRRRDEPRTIDIDLLAYDDVVLSTDELTLPHPRMHLRGFVLHPLREIAPDWRHPVRQMTAAEMLAAAGPLEKVERWEGTEA